MYEQTTLPKVVRKIIQNKRNKKEKTTTQESLNFKKMYANGICKLNDNEYSKMIKFSDISYQLVRDEEKRRIFSIYSSLLNSFDVSVDFQFCFINFKHEEQSEKTVQHDDDDFTKLKKEYEDFINQQKEKGNNGIIRNKYLVFKVKDRELSSAIRRLESIENSVSEIFRSMGVQTEGLLGNERLVILNYIFNSESKYVTDIESKTKEELFDSKLAKSLIAPVKIDYQVSKDYFKLPNKYTSTNYFNIIATELSDRVLADILDVEDEMIVSIHIKPMQQQKAIKMVKTKTSDLNTIKIEEQKKSLERGYDMDILPTDLNMHIDESKNILRELQKDNERYFFITFTITNFGSSKKTLENSIYTTKMLAQKHNCELIDLTLQQEKAFLSAIPLGQNINEKDLERGLTTSSVAVFVPFTTQELYEESNFPVYYGLNALSSNVIQVSRKNLKNPNGLFLGTPGSGKSFSAKREMIDTFLNTNDDILICDPEAEYGAMVELLKGEVIKLSLTAKEYINPLDLSMEYGEGENPVVFKSDFVMTLMNIIAGGKDGITARQRTLTDKATRIIYRSYLETQDENDMPILEDLYNEFRRIQTDENDKEAKELADALELYVHGSLDVFNHRTNINPKNRLVCFDIKELGTNLKDLGMLILQDHVWNRVTVNRGQDIKTWYYMDEFHKLLAEEQTSNYSVEFWKRFRKWGGIPTGITQNVKDLLASPKIETIIENSDFIYLLNQASDDRRILQTKLDISDYQAGFVTNSNEGEGLIIYNGVIIPFKDKFPKNNSLYPVMTTKPEEIKKLRNNKVQYE